MESTLEITLDLILAFLKDIKDGIHPLKIKDVIIKEATKELSGEELGSFIIFIENIVKLYE